MQEEKLKQLKTIFENTIKDVILNSKINLNIKEARENYINETVNKLVYEVKNRINNK